jgi:hypothetical protein
VSKQRRYLMDWHLAIEQRSRGSMPGIVKTDSSQVRRGAESNPPSRDTFRIDALSNRIHKNRGVRRQITFQPKGPSLELLLFAMPMESVHRSCIHAHPTDSPGLCWLD